MIDILPLSIHGSCEARPKGLLLVKAGEIRIASPSHCHPGHDDGKSEPVAQIVEGRARTSTVRKRKGP